MRLPQTTHRIVAGRTALDRAVRSVELPLANAAEVHQAVECLMIHRPRVQARFERIVRRAVHCCRLGQIRIVRVRARDFCLVEARAVPAAVIGALCSPAPNACVRRCTLALPSFAVAAADPRALNTRGMVVIRFQRRGPRHTARARTLGAVRAGKCGHVIVERCKPTFKSSFRRIVVVDPDVRALVCPLSAFIILFPNEAAARVVVVGLARANAVP